MQVISLGLPQKNMTLVLGATVSYCYSGWGPMTMFMTRVPSQHGSCFHLFGKGHHTEEMHRGRLVLVPFSLDIPSISKTIS